MEYGHNGWLSVATILAIASILVVIAKLGAGVGL
jgi:hypothetical protein